ncbi:MAG TPA: amidohydrolase family protein [Clostridiales bacterium]|nr:amidohydrolase family protein [Clostridiales bacterium]
MIIDVNTYIGNYPFRPIRNNSPREFVNLMDRHDIDKACVSSLSGIYYRDVIKGNYELLEGIAPYQDRLIPVCNINPIYAKSMSDFCECVEKLGFKGVKLFPRQHGYELSNEKSVELLNKAAEYGVFVQLPLYIEDLRQRHPMDIDYPLSAQEIMDAALLAPKTDFILSNYSFSTFKDVFHDISNKRQGHIYYDISRVECLKRNFIADMLEFTDIEHLLFGTGAPLEYIDVQLVKLSYFPQTLGLTEKQIELIKSGNMIKLLRM